MDKDVKKGTAVEIITKSGKKISGIVDDLGIKKDGKNLMVVLKSGDIGRVVGVLNRKPKTEIEELIKIGESSQIEFKTDALWSVFHKNQDINESKSYDLRTFKQKASKVIIAKSISALANSSGGILAIGVRENKLASKYEVIGIDEDLERLKKLEKDFSIDGYKRMIIDDIIRPYFPSKIYNSLGKYIIIKFEEYLGKTICLIKINKSDTKIFLDLEGRKIFMIRTETQSRQIVDEELVDYCMDRFR